MGIHLERSLPGPAAAARQQMTAGSPMRRLGDPLEVAGAAVFLGFDAIYTTGSGLAVDGGTSQL